MKLANAVEISENISDENKIYRNRLLELGFSAKEVGAIQHDIMNFREFSESCSQHVVALVTDAHSNTWFSTEYLPNVVHTQSGVLAGTPLADLIFGAIMCRILARVRIQLRGLNLIPDIHHLASENLCEVPQGSDVPDVSYVVMSSILSSVMLRP